MAASIAVMSTTDVAAPSLNDSSSTTTAESSSSSSLNISLQTLTEDVNNVNNGNVEMMDELQKEQQSAVIGLIAISGTFNSDDSYSSSTTVRALMFAKSTHAFFSFPSCLLCL